MKILITKKNKFMKKVQLNDPNLIDMEISIQVEKNGWKILKEQKHNITGKHYYVVECIHCGNQKLVDKWAFNKSNTHVCKACNWEFVRTVIGKTFGTIQVLEFDHMEKNPINGHSPYLYFKTKCTVCGRESIRYYNATQWNKSNGCKFCNSKSSITDNAAYNSLWRNYIQGATDRNIEWNLSPDDFLNIVTRDCYYCGASPTVRSKRIGRARKDGFFDTPVNGIDRIDSSKGYEKDNCITCCSTCNYMKQVHSQEEFLLQIQKIYHHLFSKGSETIEKTSEKDGTK